MNESGDVTGEDLKNTEAELIETPVVEVAEVAEVADAVYVISVNDTNCEELETIVNGHIDRLNNGRDPGKVIRSLQKIYIDIIESINNPARLTTSPRLPASGLMDVVMRSNVPENLETREVLAQKYEISLNKIRNKIHDIVL